MSMPTILPSSPAMPRYPQKSLNLIKPNFVPQMMSDSSPAAVEKTGDFRPRTMVRRTNVSRDIGNGDAVFEKEPLFNGSAGFHGLESTINRMSKWILVSSLGFVLLWRHDAEGLWFVMGSILNAVLCGVLKRVFNQERPVLGLRKDPGMPSSHAQSVWFIAIYTVLLVLEMVRDKEMGLFISLLILGFAAYVSWLRVSHKLHTMNQVLVGALVGSSSCILWYSLWHSIVQEAFVSSLWVQTLVVLGAAGCSLGLIFYIIRKWF